MGDKKKAMASEAPTLPPVDVSEVKGVLRVAPGHYLPSVRGLLSPGTRLSEVDFSGGLDALRHLRATGQIYLSEEK